MLASNFKKFALVTFDCTNTLLYFSAPPEVHYLKQAVKCGLNANDFNTKLMKENFRRKFKELSLNHRNFGKDSIGYERWWTELVKSVFTQSTATRINESKLNLVAEKLINQYQTKECWTKAEKADELIEQLKNEGKVVGVISNYDPRLHHLLADVGLTKFDFIMTSYEAAAEKPEVKIFHEALAAANAIAGRSIQPKEAIHLGNELAKDYEGAKRAGWSSVLINSVAQNTTLSFLDIQQFYKTCSESPVDL